ncbi:MAG: hypothetical protein WCA35_13070, partial [Kovacikia sp.]
MKLLKWCAAGLTGLMLWTFLSSGQILSAFFAIVAIALFIPWFRHRLIARIPPMASPLLLTLAWIVLFFGSCAAFEFTGEISNLRVCHQLQQGECAVAQSPFLATSPKLYLTGEATDVSDRAELQLTLQQQIKDGQTRLIDTVKVKPTLTKMAEKSRIMLEFQPKELPAGDYSITIESSQRRFNPITQKFSVWDTALRELKICGDSQDGNCAKDTAALVRDRRKLYLSAAPDTVAKGMDVDWSLQYTSEPGQTK